MLIESGVWTVVRGKIHRDNSLEYNATTCFPAPPAGPCADDYLWWTDGTTDAAVSRQPCSTSSGLT
jgi:hypothetical protein